MNQPYMLTYKGSLRTHWKHEIATVVFSRVVCKVRCYGGEIMFYSRRLLWQQHLCSLFITYPFFQFSLLLQHKKQEIAGYLYELKQM